MVADNAAPLAPPLFSALITPHRSLGAHGFVVLMALLCGVSFVAGVVFLVVGAWPVVGFLGLDVALVYWAFRANYRGASAYEEVTVTAEALTLRKVGAQGQERSWTLNPLRVRLDRETDPEFGLRALFLVSHGRKVAIGGALAPAERESFAAALTTALGEARRGPTRTPSP